LKYYVSLHSFPCLQCTTIQCGCTNSLIHHTDCIDVQILLKPFVKLPHYHIYRKECEQKKTRKMRNEVQEHPNRHLEEALMEKLVGVAANIETQFLQYLLFLLHDVGLVD
jgi:hypothetical protein